MQIAFLGIDVGTGSARAGVFDAHGRLLASGRHDIRIWHGNDGITEQSTSDVWSAVCAAARSAVATAGLEASAISGIGVDATCSLVVVDQVGRPLPVGPSDDPERNVIVWMDHRATRQAQRINGTGHSLLGYLGGRISPEMQTPKLLWLMEHRPDTYAAAAHFFDLSDYLTWRMTGSLARSVCTVTCKWAYLAHEMRWDRTFFEAAGLTDLASDTSRIGKDIVAAGAPLGQGLSRDAAADLNLLPGIPVGAALIDAHAGGVGTLGSAGAGPLGGALAYIFGTSACAMAVTREPVFVPGVWGPYYSAMVPRHWLSEAGQSAAGAAIERLTAMHPAARELAASASAAGLDLPSWIERQVVQETRSFSPAARRASGVHVVPEFSGNRSPFADPDARAVIVGLSADRTASSLLDIYIAALCGVGYGLRQIIGALHAHRIPIDRIVISGGAGRSSLVCQLLADATGMPVVLPDCPEPVLLGAAMLGAAAASYYPSVPDAMDRMAGTTTTYEPDRKMGSFHARKALVFEALQNVERGIRHSFELQS
jgi:D-ribulokinase